MDSLKDPKSYPQVMDSYSLHHFIIRKGRTLGIKLYLFINKYNYLKMKRLNFNHIKEYLREIGI
jgi:hypothetical protein